MSAATDEAVHEALQPRALEKARSLREFALRRGSPLNEYEVTLTDEEGFELVQWFRDGSGLIAPEGLAQLDADIALAKRSKDPWVVLDNFTLFGLNTAPLRSRS